MRFRQLDQIVELEPGVKITAERTLSDRDRFFEDHFPEFPILPGVLSLEAMSQACDWLLRKSDDFARSVVVLKEARNVKYSGFAQPGQKLTVTAELKKLDDRFGKFAARVTVDDRVTANARLVLERFDLAQRYPARATTDPILRKDKLEQFDVLDPQSPNHHPVPPTSFRWMWIDRFTEFVSGRRASAVKTVSLTDETLDLYMPGFPVMPCSVIVEGLAQTGGILVSEFKNYEKEVVLAKVSKAVFHRPALPGETMAYSAEIADVQPEGAIVHGTSHIGGELHAEFELFFAYLGGQLGELELISPADLLGMLRLYSLYDVAKTDQGDPLDVPQPLLDAEREKTSGADNEA
jgi:3-hydroxyacyl-[acyl-carrier-protein] dehydratase